MATAAGSDAPGRDPQAAAAAAVVLGIGREREWLEECEFGRTQVEVQAVDTDLSHHPELTMAPVLHWVVWLRGPKRSMWDAANFQIDLYFPRGYPKAWPAVFMRTVPFHPNVDPDTGRIAEALLRSLPSVMPECTIEDALGCVQQVLAGQELEWDDVVLNPAAALALVESPERYRDIGYDCIVAANRVRDGLPPLPDARLPARAAVAATTPVAAVKGQGRAGSPARGRRRVVRDVNYDEYVRSWRETGRTRPATVTSTRSKGPRAVPTPPASTAPPCARHGHAHAHAHGQEHDNDGFYS